MVTIPNILSLLRVPLALVFLQENPLYRALAIVLAMATDWLDGYLARRHRMTSRFGTVLDPLTDKFFVFVVLSTLIHEQRLNIWEAMAMLCRDFSVIIFGFYLALSGTLASYRFRAIWCGKITTTLQFFVLLGLTFQVPFPPFVFGSFILLGVLALGELYLDSHKLPISG